MRNICQLLVEHQFIIVSIMKRILFISGAIILSASISYAETSFPHGLQMGGGVSATSGLNIMLGYNNSEFESYWWRRFGVRVDFASTEPLKSAIDSAIDSYMRDGRDIGDGVKIDEGKLDAWHAALLLDYYPFAGAWRLTGGYTWGGATLDSAIFGEIAQAPSQRFYFYLAGDHYYYNGNNFDGVANIDWNYHGPYLGTGFDFDLLCNFSLYIDIGLVFTSRPAKMALDIPQEQLYVYNKLAQTWLPVTIPQLNADVSRATDDANRKLSDFKFYPMIKLGFAYRF